MAEAGNAIDGNALRSLSEPLVLPWLKDLFIDWAVLTISLSLVYFMPNPVTIFFCIIILGNRQHGLAILGHEGTHGRIAKSRWLNDLLSNIFCFWPLGLTASGYRKLHNQHHKNTGTEHDPELAHKRSRSPQWDLPAKPLKILKYAFLDMVGLSLPDYYIIVTYSKPEKNSDYIPLGLWHILFIGAFIFTSFWWIPILWYASLVTTFMLFFRLRLWLEHQGTSDTHRLHLTPVEGAILAPHNIWYHWEHHKYACIPYHQLPKARHMMTNVPVMKLTDLLEFFDKAAPSKSGQIL